jgi:hypothetical protein
MYACWISLVAVPETWTAAISTLCLFHVHTCLETKYTALASWSSQVQLLKWRDRWPHYLCSVANVCISFVITLVWHISWIYIFLYFNWSFKNVNPIFAVSLNESVFSWNGKMHFGQIFSLLSEIFLHELFSLLTTDMFSLLKLCYVGKYYLWFSIWIVSKIAYSIPLMT